MVGDMHRLRAHHAGQVAAMRSAVLRSGSASTTTHCSPRGPAGTVSNPSRAHSTTRLGTLFSSVWGAAFDRSRPILLCWWRSLLEAGQRHSRSAYGMAAAIATRHSTGSDSCGRCTTENGHSMRSAGNLTWTIGLARTEQVQPTPSRRSAPLTNTPEATRVGRQFLRHQLPRPFNVEFLWLHSLRVTSLSHL